MKQHPQHPPRWRVTRRALVAAGKEQTVTVPAPAGAPAPPADPPPGTTPDPSGQTPPPAGPPAPGTPAPPPTPPVDPPAGKTFDEAYVRQLREEAAQRRTEKTAAEQRAADLEAKFEALRLALDPNAKPTDDPAKAAEQAVRERDELAARVQKYETERLAEKLGRKAGADVDLLLDSRGFEVALGKLDSTSATFEADVEALIKGALEANPRLKATPAGPPASGREPTGGSTPAREPAAGLDRLRSSLAPVTPGKRPGK